MGVIEKAQELGETLMADERCKKYQAAKAAYDSDAALQQLIGEFNLKKMQLNKELEKDSGGQDGEKVNALQDNLKDIYAKVMENKSMKAFYDAKKAVDELLEHINSIIQISVTGEASGCGGDCGSCHGCH